MPEVPATADKPVHPHLDLFFRYELTGQNPEGERGNIPHLGGCSGGPIWDYREPEGLRFWTVDQCVKLVGVQSSLKRSGLYFRVKSAKYIRAMLDKLVEEHPRT